MPKSTFSGFITSPLISDTVDMGNPFLNRTVDGFLKIGTVAASRVAVEEAYQCVRRGKLVSVLIADMGVDVECN
ncbi:hypothetical protein OPV22_006666 [Ensete ventricosum]|uniref:Uncharacterized protein n=1 Tax=Ensete ventricosum TaxID=4639 RepID=A0AAV8RFJ5_ENSVE|nr:hypothetical protein OPV22_006666 [Ensete ventricosum]